MKILNHGLGGKEWQQSRQKHPHKALLHILNQPTVSQASPPNMLPHVTNSPGCLRTNVRHLSTPLTHPSLRKPQHTVSDQLHPRGSLTWAGVISSPQSDPTTGDAELDRGQISMAQLTHPVLHDLDQLNTNLRNVVGERHPMLMAAADQIFGAGGKKLRPVIVFLVARATMAMSGSK